MTVQRMAGDTVADEKSIRVNLAADDGKPYRIDEVTLKDEADQTVYAMRFAQQIDSVEVQRQDTEGANQGVLFAGIYDADGGLLQYKTVPVTGSGRYTLGLSLEDCPEDRHIPYLHPRFLPGGQPDFKALVTSDDEHYLLDTLSQDASTELVAGVDQKDNKLVVFNQNATDWNDSSSVVWQWGTYLQLRLYGHSLLYQCL